MNLKAEFAGDVGRDRLDKLFYTMGYINQRCNVEGERKGGAACPGLDMEQRKLWVSVWGRKPNPFVGGEYVDEEEDEDAIMIA